MMNKKTINNCKRFLQENKPLYLELNLPIYGIIYKIENIITGSVYIGQTKRSFTERYNGGLKGWIKDKKIDDDISDFKVTEILDVAFCKYQLDLLEMYYINKYDSYYDGYNEKLNYPSYKDLLNCCDILKGTGYRIDNINIVKGEISQKFYEFIKLYNYYCYSSELYFDIKNNLICYYENIINEYFVKDINLCFTIDYGLYLRRYLIAEYGYNWYLSITDKNIKEYLPKELYKQYKKPSSRKYKRNYIFGLNENEKELISIGPCF